LKYSTALQRQAGEARIEGQYQAEIARAGYGKDAANLASRAQQILGLHSAAASRSQALGAIAGGYAMSTQMTEAQRQATIGLLEQSRRQQVTGLLADRSFGEQQTHIAMRREEYDLRISQADADASRSRIFSVTRVSRLPRSMSTPRTTASAERSLRWSDTRKILGTNEKEQAD
ncbi:MAG: hypothetical protein ACREEM_49045, partial [Blastocatellia bacterium]